MVRRLVVLLVLGAAFVATPALADYGQQKQQVDEQLAAVQAKLARTRAHAQQLSAQIGGLTKQIHGLEAEVGDVSTRLAALQADLRLREQRLAKLNTLYTVQTGRLHDLRSQYRLALARLEQRLVSIYEAPAPGALELVLQAKSFQNVLDDANYLSLVAKQDKQISLDVKAARRAVRVARTRTAAVRLSVRQQATAINARVQQAAILRGQLLSTQSRLAGARAQKSGALVATKAQEAGEIKESQALQSASAALSAKIRAASQNDGSEPAAPSAAGFIWPVNGPITSPFGPRWGTIHPGIDIGVPAGTPIHAAAAGTVIWCGWESGYGNLTVIDHHNGLATAYGHQSKIEVSCGEDVAQGQEIGLVGCTGYCFGPHLHFEVRVNGTPADPLGYLP
jgi:murein DD-endopeptidase MepM/ murein hydrolase activator NlpD